MQFAIRVQTLHYWLELPIEDGLATLISQRFVTAFRASTHATKLKLSLEEYGFIFKMVFSGVIKDRLEFS